LGESLNFHETTINRCHLTFFLEEVHDFPFEMSENINC